MTRPNILKVGQHEMIGPMFFPSVSSIKTNMLPVDYVNLLCSLKSEQFLVSAYDLHHSDIEEREQMFSKISEARQNCATILMDSGNYESYWNGHGDTWRQDSFHQILSRTECDFAFGFDEQVPPANEIEHLDLMCERYKSDQSVNSSAEIIPIVHGQSDALPRLCAKIVDSLAIDMVAVPERRLGDGIVSRARCVAEIRDALNATGKYVGLHLLGTGNPISIATYARMGADSFDGLEWCQTCVDHETGLLFHFAQADLFHWQTSWGAEDISFKAKTLAHNLEFYDSWMGRLVPAIHSDQVGTFCKEYFPGKLYSTLEKNLGWV